MGSQTCGGSVKNIFFNFVLLSRDDREASGAQQLCRALLRAALHQAQPGLRQGGEGEVFTGEQAAGSLPGRAQVCDPAINHISSSDSTCQSSKFAHSTEWLIQIYCS